MLVPIASITQRTPNARSLKDPSEFKALVASLEAEGQLQPVLISKIAGENGSSTYELHAGNSRLDAAIQLGWTEIEAFEKKDVKSPEHAKVLNLLENIRRKDLHPVDVCEALHDLECNGMSRKEIEKHAQLSRQGMGHYLNVRTCTAYDAWREDARLGRWTPSFRQMVVVAGRGKEALPAYQNLILAHQHAEAELRGEKAAPEEEASEGGGDGEEKVKGTKVKRQSADTFADERKFFRKLCKGWEKDNDQASNPATGKPPSKADRERAACVLEVLEWATKSWCEYKTKREELAAPSEEFRAIEVEEEEVST